MNRLVIALTLAWFCAGCSNFIPGPTATDFKVNPLFADNMVIQRDMRNRVWGTALPGERVGVEINNREYSAVADQDGNWSVLIDALPVGGPYMMRISGKNRIDTINNILSGDVWLCAGQTNMQWSVSSAADATAEIAAANYPQIRFFQVPHVVSDVPVTEVSGKWQVCTPQTVADFSAAGYYFGRDLYKQIGVPIGLINVSWGGTPVEAWTDRAWLRKNAELKPIMDRHDRLMKVYPEKQAEYEKFMRERKNMRIEDMMYYNDPGDKGAVDLEKANYDDGQWKTMSLPGIWENYGLDIDGVVWFRKSIDIPAAWKGKELELSLGPIDDFDTTYFNGTRIGGIGRENHNAWRTPRRYRIPGELVNAGKTVIAVRVFDRVGSGGFSGDSEDIYIQPVDGGNNRISLQGEWKYSAVVGLKPKVISSRIPYGPKHPHMAGGLYNGMINPLIPFSIKGAICYQGENNTGRAWQYRTLFPAMIDSWRTSWRQGDFPFLIVQLANYHRANAEPVDSAWAELREAQAVTAEKIPVCALAVTIDIGEASNINPKNKQVVGHRLMLTALKLAYGKDIVFSGPEYLSHETKGGKVIVRFTNIGSGLEARDGDLKRFQIAGNDRKFIWADAKVIGKDLVEVSSPGVKDPVAVRYAWSDNPAGCNLYNKEGLPAVPFRTDDWQLTTFKAR